MDIAVGCFHLSGFTQVADLLPTRPGKVRIPIGRTHTPTLTEIAAGYSPRESNSAAGYHAARNRRQETDAAQARGSTLALLANGGVRQGCRVAAGSRAG